MNEYRVIEPKIKKHFDTYKQAIVLLGARQVGKTTLLKRLFPDALYLLVDEKPVIDLLETYSSDNYKKLLKKYNQVFIDEIHLLSNPGRAVKIIYDQFPGMQIIITGSSSLHIKNKTAESMAGRAIDYHLYPLTFWEYLYQLEIEKDKAPIKITDKIVGKHADKTVRLYSTKDLLFDVLKFGLYPEILNQIDSQTYLTNLAEKAIFKDIVELNLIENRSKALELLKVLAFQIGNLINYAELSRKLGLSIPTIQRYIEIFEQSFILFRLFPYSKNKRDEIGKSPKIYFWDIGLRNALINSFEDINLRDDIEAMFENFIISEVKKEIDYFDLNYNVNYWRIKSGSEVDLVLSNNSELHAVEIKINKGSVSKAFTNRYPHATTTVLTVENFF